MILNVEIAALMKKYSLFCTFVIAVLIGFLGGIQHQKSVHKCPKCPDIVPQKIEVRDSSIVQQTQVVTVPLSTIKRVTERRTVFVVDTVDDTVHTVVPRQETVNCWETDVLQRDSARIYLKICSRVLPEYPPDDLEPTIEYTPPPRVKIIDRSNTAILPCPNITGNRFGWNIGPYIGAGVDWRGRPSASAGIALTWGIRLGKLTVEY
jgi:hypothetical protein